MVEKITIENLRREALNAVCDERKSIIISRKRKLQELYAVCRHVERSKEFPNGDIVAAWGYGGANMEDTEKRFLEENDMEKARLFKESTLPQHSSYLPEPGGFSKATRARTPVYPSISPGASTPSKSAVQLSPIFTPTVDRSPKVPSDFAISTGAEPPAEKKQRRNPSNELVLSERAARLSTSNGNGQDTSTDDQLTPSSEPQQDPLSNVSALSLAVDSRPEPLAPIFNIGGVPVVQGAVTKVPDGKEEAMGVHPPPVPTALTDRLGEDVMMHDTAPSDKQLTESTETIDDLAQLEETASTQTDPEIPDSQKSISVPTATMPSSRPVTTIFGRQEEAHLPANPSQLQQLPPHAPLLVVTAQQNRPFPISFASPQKDSLIHPEVSSPTSSVDGGDGFGTPGNAALSSATSPDPSHMALETQPSGPEKTETRQVISENGGDMTVSAAQAQEDENTGAVVEKNPGCGGEQPAADLPSVSLTEGVVEAGVGTEPSSTTTPLLEAPSEDSSLLAQEQKEISFLHNASEAKGEVSTYLQAQKPTTEPLQDKYPTLVSVKPMDPSIIERVLPIGQPKSPDPSAQLRLEHQLANGAPIPPVVTTDRATLAPTESKVEPEPVMPQTHEEEEEEDQVQLVGSREPEPFSARIKTPTETPAQSKNEYVETAKEAVEGVLVMKGEGIPVYIPSPRPEPEVPAEDRQGTKLVGVGEGKEKIKNDVEMGEAKHHEPEAISVPYQPSPESEMEPEVEAGGGATKELQKEEEEIHDEDERMHDTEERAPEVSLDSSKRPIPPPTEESITPKPDSVVEKQIEPAISTLQIIDKRVLEPTLAANFNLPTPDATDVRPSAPASTISISPQRPKSSKVLGRIKAREKSRSKLRKVVISSAHHAAAAAEAEAKQLREDQENQGIIIIKRRHEQQATAARRRGAQFPPGSKTEVITRYGVADPPSTDGERKKNTDIFDVLYTVKSAVTSAKDLISRANKTVSTSNHQVHYFESQAARILELIQKNQDLGNSSLRQITRAREPKRRKCHWDYLIDEAKWLREDFREERRWKIAVAKQMADWCVEWHDAREDRQELCVDKRRWGRVPKGKREEKRKVASGGDVDMGDAGGFSEFNQPTPELVIGGATPEDEGSEDYFPRGDENDGVVGWGNGRDFFGYLQNPPPAALFTLSPEETMFEVAPTKAAEDMLGQLPLFAPPKPPNIESRRFEHVDEEWMTPIIPVVKYCSGKLSLQQEEGPPRKKSRYEYDENYELFADDSDEDDIGDGAYIGQHGKREKDKTKKPVPLPPEKADVALFNPASKSLLHRIHNTHLFRPPSDLPPAAFFESRIPSLWTSAEDEMLKQLAREYHHNWALVSTCMQLEGTWHSGSERRSPWECFERWIGLEPVSQEFMKSPFYKPVQQRLDIAARVGGVYVANPGSAGGNNPSGVTKRRGTVPVKVEKRRVTKYFTIFEAMRKLAKKRETSISKQQSGRAAQMAAMRKAQDPPNNPPTQKIPAFFSQMKYERELKHLEHKAMFSVQLQMQARDLKGQQPLPAQAGRLHPAQQQAIANGVPIPGQRVPQAGMPNGLPPGARPPSSVAIQNGNVPVGINGVPMNARVNPQAQIRGQQMTSEQLAHLRSQLAKQQAAAQGQSTYSQAQLGISPGLPVGANGNQQQQQAVKAMMLQQAQQAALGGQKMANVPNGQAGSPRMQNQQPLNQQQQQQAAGRVFQLTVAEMTALVQHQHPHLPQDQVAKVTQQHLANYHQQLSQNMARTANGNGQGVPNMASSPTSSQFLTRVQARGAAANTGPMIGANGPVGQGANGASRSATPQQQRSASVQSPMSVQQSPRLGQAMLAGQQQAQQGQGQGQ